jgi:hypothetical protein
MDTQAWVASAAARPGCPSAYRKKGGARRGEHRCHGGQSMLSPSLTHHPRLAADTSPHQTLPRFNAGTKPPAGCPLPLRGAELRPADMSYLRVSAIWCAIRSGLSLGP